MTKQSGANVETTSARKKINKFTMDVLEVKCVKNYTAATFKFNHLYWSCSIWSRNEAEASHARSASQVRQHGASVLHHYPLLYNPMTPA